LTLRDDRHAYVICDRRTEDVFVDAAIAAGFMYLRTIIWNKLTPALGQGVYRSQYEVVLLLTKGRRAGYSRSLGDVLSFPRVASRGHYPTEKPVGLLKTLIGQSSQPGELVLDPFCGSGSTGRAARELGRRALLCDLDASTAARRLRVDFVAVDCAAALRNSQRSARPVGVSDGALDRSRRPRSGDTGDRYGARACADRERNQIGFGH